VTIYKAGCISAANGSNIVEGFGTRWLTYVHAGDTITIYGVDYTIDAVTDNYLLTLTAPYTGLGVDRIDYLINCFPVVPSLAQLQAEAAARVDALAGATRLNYVTIAPGQEMTYTAKLAAANAYIAAGYPADAMPYPWINTEATLTGATPTAVADSIVTMAGLWSVIGATIEGRRLATKQTISGAITSGQIDAAEQAFIVAMQSL